MGDANDVDATLFTFQPRFGVPQQRIYSQFIAELSRNENYRAAPAVVRVLLLQSIVKFRQRTELQ